MSHCVFLIVSEAFTCSKESTTLENTQLKAHSLFSTDNGVWKAQRRRDRRDASHLRHSTPIDIIFHSFARSIIDFPWLFNTAMPITGLSFISYTVFRFSGFSVSLTLQRRQLFALRLLAPIDRLGIQSCDFIRVNNLSQTRPR